MRPFEPLLKRSDIGDAAVSSHPRVARLVSILEGLPTLSRTP